MSVYPLLLVVVLTAFVGILVLYLRQRRELGRQNRVVGEALDSLGAMLKHLTGGDFTFIGTDVYAARSMGSTGNETLKRFRPLFEEYRSLVQEPLHRLGFVGANTYQEGKEGARLVGESLHGKGEVAVQIFEYAHAAMATRKRGFENELTEKYPGIRIVDGFQDHGSLDRADRELERICKAYPKLGAVYVTSILSHTDTVAVVEKHRQDPSCFIVAHDFYDDTAPLLRKGTLRAVVSQDPFAQGFSPIVHLCNHLSSDWTPRQPLLYTPIAVITAQNVDQFYDGQTRKAALKGSPDRLPILMPQTDRRPFKIAFVNDQSHEFFRQVNQGFEFAAEKLRQYPSIQVKTFDMPLMNPDFGKLRPLLEKTLDVLIQEGYTGLAIPVFRNEMIPLLNTVIERGVTVISVNTEPISIRSLFAWLVQSSQRQNEISQTFSSSLGETGIGLQEIVSSFHQIAENAVSQAVTAAKGRESLEAVNTAIEDVYLGANGQKEALDVAAGIMQSLETAVATVAAKIDEMTALRAHMNHIVEQIKKMAEDSKRIGEIVGTIDDIAGRTNLLALNAAIEAARAGESGKGFKVVSGEIRELSAQATEAASQIENLIRGVRDDINSSVGLITKNTDTVQAGIGQISGVMDTLADYSRKLAQVLVAVRQSSGHNADLTDQMRRSTQVVSTVVSESAAVAENNSAATEEVSSAVEEISAQVQELTRRIVQLAELSQALEGGLANFSV